MTSIQSQAVDLKNCRVLLVEDERIVREILVRQVKAAGITDVVDVRDAEAAWMLLAGGADRFHVLITDLVLPGMPGETLIMKLRSLANPRTRALPVVVLTGNNTVEKYKQLEKFAISGYLVKPVSPSVLKSAIENALAGRIASATPAVKSRVGAA